ncbi:MAG TPA: (Fe-S)-binding protein [Geobacter sulfurreducens]|jgi:Fe-S oxidoreductase|uniref:heterodisulfide reductase-related iron-sulfur binding cluster n=1 Tax=Geobacter sulfurreducens TaxID=35554 RepID=UPI0001D8F543|nr:heterodisulfide reductase-related iron-sulfur binding cluster [Geobacter sulfurreducens]ADI85544.1 electron transfer flavoprotein-associated cytochrome b and CCG domain pair iron-sulfur cluster-binding oxidoreductase [Geobacter sulfurreducens KN400]AJY69062.1 electron transfer flavoprotein [Geobacter sulfurreducens]HBB70312.1 (Fe-S)-binding protein [Geobacter sulfurreducens]HCD97526.1 (Fe-S)-binding protein [Geobacter sulfurreducens]
MYMHPNPAVFAPLLLASLAFFAWSLYRKLSLVTLGRPGYTFRGVGEGLREMLLYAFVQKRVLHKFFGLNHLVIFWACMVLAFVNVEFVVSGVFPAARLSALPDALYVPIRFLSDVMSALTLVAIAIALVRRTFFPPYPEARSFESYLILVLIAVHMIAFFGVSAAEIARGEERAAAFMPIASFFGEFLADLTPKHIEATFNFYWWLHAAALLSFITVLIPFTKHLHVFTAIANCFLHPEARPNTQLPEVFEAGRAFGVGQVDRFTVKDLFDPFACTKCGRCQQVCPANITGKPLNPRQVVNDIKVNLLANGPLLKRGGVPTLPLIGDGGPGSVSEESIWACTSCGACMEACPVFIEHLPKIVGMRRHLVEMEARFPEELLNLFENMEQRSNPWGIAPGERTKWASLLDVKPFAKGETEYLLYVGCAGSFDSRSKQVTVNLATILDAAGISWGILGKDEKCCGDSLRRLGNEYVFDRMARENVALFRERGVTKVIAQCPHCFTTLKNDYRQYGIELEVIHHAELIRQLLAEGRLKLDRRVSDLGKIILHDSCYLGRHNDVYEAPREVVATVTGTAPTEFDRARDESFCCGAGGGRMWMEEQTGTRINLNRVSEALSKNPDTICVACPYCMTMFEDGLKDKQAGQTRVRDIAEVVAEGMRPVS